MSVAQACTQALRAANLRARYVVGGAMQPFLSQLVAESPLAEVFEPLVVRNDFFGGNVDVTGLLCGCDIARAVVACETAASGLDCPNAERALGQHDEDGLDAAEPSGAPHPGAEYPGASHPRAPHFRAPRNLFLVPRVIFNDDGVTLDDMSLEDMEKAAGTRLYVVSCNPSDFLPEITALCRQR